MQKTLEERWYSLWGRVSQDESDYYLEEEAYEYTAYYTLTERYKEPHRFYHTLTHIEHCLDEFEAVRHTAKNQDALEMAVWFHDAIYNTKADDNEEKSAEIFRRVAKTTPFLKDFTQQTTTLILATKHKKIPFSFDERLIADIDLSIFGQPEEGFDAYEEKIRKEYEWVPEEIFIKARLDILESFLKRPMIYYTLVFWRKYEQKAQQNLFRSQARLRHALFHE